MQATSTAGIGTVPRSMFQGLSAAPAPTSATQAPAMELSRVLALPLAALYCSAARPLGAAAEDAWRKASPSLLLWCSAPSLVCPQLLALLPSALACSCARSPPALGHRWLFWLSLTPTSLWRSPALGVQHSSRSARLVPSSGALRLPGVLRPSVALALSCPPLPAYQLFSPGAFR